MLLITGLASVRVTVVAETLTLETVTRVPSTSTVKALVAGVFVVSRLSVEERVRVLPSMAGLDSGVSFSTIVTVTLLAEKPA